MELFPFDSNKVESTVSRYNALDFGIEYKNTIGRSSNIDTYLYANVTSINRHPEGDYIRDVSVKTLAGNNFSVRAKYYVLSAGGIENLGCSFVNRSENGLCNEYDSGTFYGNLYYPNGVILLQSRVQL
jgi:hypothetical protein